MGAGILALLLGVAALVVMMPSSGPKEKPLHERTLLWIYDKENPTGSGVGAIMEETEQEGRLVAVSFPAPERARQLFERQSDAKKVQAEVAALAGREVHHIVFLPHSVIEVLIKATGGIEVDGQTMDGPTAIRHITEDAAKGPDRALQVMLAVSDAAMYKQFNLSAGEALRLAGQIKTDLDLMKFPEVLQRWSSYQNPQIVMVEKLTPEAVQGLLQPDPPKTEK